MIQYQRYLEKCSRVVSVYLHHLMQYKLQIPRDPSLSPQAKEKMKALINQFASRINEFLEVISGAQKELKEEESQRETIAEEFVKISNYLERLLATTPQLQGIKVKIDAEIKKGETAKKTTTKVATNKKSINEQWLESVAEEFSKKGKTAVPKKTIRNKMCRNPSPEKILSPADVTNYLEGFRKIQEEFVLLKEDIRKLKEEPHVHNNVESQLRSVGKSTIKICTENKVVHQEQADLLLQLRALTKKIVGLENENEELVKKLRQIMGGEEKSCLPSYGEKSVTSEAAPKTGFPFPRSIGLTPASNI